MRSLLALALLLAACGSAPVAPRPPATSATLIGTVTAASSPTPDAAPLRYVAIGASDSVGVGATDPATGSWPARLARRLPPGSELVDLAVSGSLAAQAAREQLPRALALRPQLVTVWLAVNDLNAGLDPAAYAAAIGAVVGPLVERTEARVFVGTVPDLRAVPAYATTDPLALGARIAAYNTAIAALAAAHPGRVVAVDLFTGSAALTSTSTVSADGFHPSDAGYALIADRFAAALAAAGLPVR